MFKKNPHILTKKKKKKSKLKNTIVICEYFVFFQRKSLLRMNKLTNTTAEGGNKHFDKKSNLQSANSKFFFQ